MKVKAYYKKGGLNSHNHERGRRDTYTKTIDIPEDSDMKLVEEAAREDAMYGFDFIRMEKL